LVIPLALSIPAGTASAAGASTSSGETAVGEIAPSTKPTVAGSCLPTAGVDFCALAGPRAGFDCIGLENSGGLSHAGPGVVIYSENPAHTSISATVELTGARRHTTYVVRLVQSDGSDCFTANGTFETNGSGVGSFTATDTIDSGATAARVIIDTGSPESPPTYSSSQLFTFET
jgi:hypothetical protein